MSHKSQSTSNFNTRAPHQGHPVTATSAPFGHIPPFLPGASSLVEQLDKRLLIVLRDGRHLIGVLRSFDQFTNFILEDTVERRFCIVQDKNKPCAAYYYTDLPLGLYLVRGDSMVLLGEVDESKQPLDQAYEVPLEELESIIERERKACIDSGKRSEIIWDFDMDLL